MANLDVNDVAIVGVNESRRREISSPVERRCAGCREHVYLSRRMLHDAAANAKRQGKKMVVVCYRCVKPWMEDILENGGDVAGNADVMEQDVIPMFERIKRERIERN